MLRALFNGQRRNRIASLLIGLCNVLPGLVYAALPIPAEDVAALRIQGSNTIGATLGPALVAGLLQTQGYRDVHVEPGAHENEQRVAGHSVDGHKVFIEVAAHGSGTGFTALKAQTADLAASSRRIKDSELTELATLGNLKSPGAEQIIAIDGVAVILHPANPLRQLNTQQLAQIFSGEVKTWEELGGTGGTIHVYARDDKSGTFDTFNELVLVKNGKTLSHTAKRFESSEQLSDEVSQDPGGIGFIGLPYVRKAQAVAIVDGNSKPMLPTVSLIATEDYPLSRRLYFYVPPVSHLPWADALVRFAQSAKGQAIVADNGFISQTVQAVKVHVSSDMPTEYQNIAKQAQRLSVNFRFAQGSAVLDNKAQRDLQRVMAYLKSHDKLNSDVTLVGFGDAKSDPVRAALLSKLRAMAVRRELIKSGVNFRDIRGFGDEMPVAGNDVDEGRIKNRRVEVWVY